MLERDVVDATMHDEVLLLFVKRRKVGLNSWWCSPLVVLICILGYNLVVP